MKKFNKTDIFPIITRLAFWSYVALFLCAIFISPLKKYIVPGLFLLVIAVVSDVFYQLITGIIEANKTKSKKCKFKPSPVGQYTIKETKTNTDLGTISNEELDYLRKRFLEQGMDDNDFYFLSEILEIFLKEEKPNKELSIFLINAIKNKNEIMLHWEPTKTI